MANGIADHLWLAERKSKHELANGQWWLELEKEYYEKNQCYRSLPLLDELMSYFRMTNKGEEVYYYYAKTQYCMGDYYLAG